MNDGEVTIGASLVTDKFDRQIAKFSKDLAAKEDELNEKAKVKLEAESNLENQQRQVQELEKSYDTLIQKRKQLEQYQGRASIPGIPTQKIIDAQMEYQSINSELTEIEKKLNGAWKEQDKLSLSAQKANAAYEKTSEKVSELKGKINGIKLQKQQADVQKMKEGFNGVGSAIQGAVKKAGRLALGIFAIRSAYLAVRRASSELASYDDQYSANLEYIRYVLTEAIAPILRGIVQLAAKLLGYINAILQGWFGISIFGKGSVDNFMKMKNAAGGVSKEVNEIKKQLSGFDEMNILQDNGDTTTGGGGGGGVAMPDIDVDDIAGKPPEWLQWIIDHKDLILTVLAGIAGGLIAVKLGLNGIAGIGIGVAIAGVVMFVRDLIDYIKDPSWEKFGRVLRDIGVAITGVGIAIGVLTGNWLVLLIGLIVMIVGLIIENWEEIQDTLSQVGDWIYKNVIEPVGAFFTGLWNGIKDTFQVVGQWFKDRFSEAWENIKNVFRGIGEFFAGIWNRIVEIFRNIGVRIGEAVSGAFKTAVNAVFTVLENILNAPIRAINGLIGIINNIPGVSLGYLSTFNLPRLKVGGIVNMPNKGTLVGGSAIAGESGREGVIPLTDNQAMETLGNAIGRHVTINATVLNKMNGRVISRSLQQVQADSDFAYNT